MTFDFSKTGEYLRLQCVASDDAKARREHALKSLQHGYGVGSEAALASLLLASLGGSTPMGEGVDAERGGLLSQCSALKQGQVHAVAPPMQHSANDESRHTAWPPGTGTEV